MSGLVWCRNWVRRKCENGCERKTTSCFPSNLYQLIRSSPHYTACKMLKEPMHIALEVEDGIFVKARRYQTKRMSISNDSGSWHEPDVMTNRADIENRQRRQQQQQQLWGGWTFVAVLTLMVALGHWCGRPTHSVSIIIGSQHAPSGGEFLLWTEWRIVHIFLYEFGGNSDFCFCSLRIDLVGRWRHHAYLRYILSCLGSMFEGHTAQER